MAKFILPKRIILAVFVIAVISVSAVVGFASASPQSVQTVPVAQAPMAGIDMADMQGMQNNTDASRAATQDMSDPDMSGPDMGLHMYMTDLRPANPADERRAAEILAELRPAIKKYEDYHVALADHYRIFGPKVVQPIYHFTNYRNAILAAFKFDPTRPTSLLYKKTPTGYELVGAMYTAPRRFTETQIDARVPLSVARWHQHIDLCLPPFGTKLQDIDFHEFGPTGSIATQKACDAAGGRWYPQTFGWMVHVYPFEADPKKIWAH
ncbi:MAG TPA: hypothetical protein VMB47_01335 [Candidatus Aquilonibacter sp.]|nr:hypothetical protein [Candidatus Aquilonibacter sp.]